MKLSTILKVAATVAGIAAVGAVVYKKVKDQAIQEAEEDIFEEDDEPEPIIEEKEKVTDNPIVRAVIGLGVGCLCGLMMVPFATEMAYHSMQTKLAQRAAEVEGCV